MRVLMRKAARDLLGERGRSVSIVISLAVGIAGFLAVLIAFLIAYCLFCCLMFVSIHLTDVPHEGGKCPPISIPCGGSERRKDVQRFP